jgi:RimJ/RimL family protein N-acetyltransferase
MGGSIIVETERLWLREYVLDDAEATFEIGRNPLVQRYTGDPCFTSVQEVRTVLLRHPLEDYRKYGFGRWAMVAKEHGKVIGMAGLKYLSEWDEVDVGYRLLPEYWGRGLATEASRASIRYGFEKLKLSRIIGLADPRNVRSVRVLEKCGLIFEKMVEIKSEQVAQYVVYAQQAKPAATGVDEATSH